MIRVYGASDDLVEVEGVNFGDPDVTDDDGPIRWEGAAKAGVSDELGAYDSAQRITIGESEATAGIGAHGVQLVVRYCGDHTGGVWGISVAPIEEDCPCPWPVVVSFDGYTTIVAVDAPDGTRVVAERVKP